MARYKVRRVTWEDFDGDRKDLVTISAAAKLLEVSVQAVSQAADRGRFTVVEDVEAANPRRGGRLLLRSEVLAAYGEEK
jgi:hypothetical protein